MASSTRLPMKTILLTTTLVAGASISRLNLKSLLLSTFTGPGSYSRILVTAIVLANLKNVPFAWHVSLAFPVTFVHKHRQNVN